MARYKLFVYKRGPLKGNKEPGIYEDRAGRKFIRPRMANGQRPYLSLGTNSISEAIKKRDARRVAKVAAKRGIAVDPEEAGKSASVTVAKIIKRYQNDGYPNKKGVARLAGKHLEAEKRYCKKLLEYFNTNTPAADLVQDDLDQFKDWRVLKVIRQYEKWAKARGEEYELPEDGNGIGLRIADLELNCLNNAMRWGVRKRMLKSNPIASRARYHTRSDSKHCREFAPASAEELHHVAGVLMSWRPSEVLGWQLLFEGMSSLRSEETVGLRLDARPDEPGGLTTDGGTLCVRRAKKSKSFNNYVQVHEGMKMVLDAHRIWHAQRYPLSPWYFPGRDRKALKKVSKSALTSALNRLHKIYLKFREQEPDPTKFPKGRYLMRKYTSHGAGRAFYVLVRRSQKIGDPQIAYELNQMGGVGTLEQVYGLPPEHWKNGKAPNLSWIPKGSPAWARIKDVDFSSASTQALTFDI